VVHDVRFELLVVKVLLQASSGGHSVLLLYIQFS
jgi:hypothetical protein